jgi:hypothetical protein
MGNHEVGLQKTSIPTERTKTRSSCPTNTHPAIKRGHKRRRRSKRRRRRSIKQRTRNRIITKSLTLEKTPEKDRSKLCKR